MKAVPEMLAERGTSTSEPPAFVDVSASPGFAGARSTPEGSAEVDTAELDAGLATARRAHAWTFIALPAPCVAAPVIVAAARSVPLVAWSSHALTLVGVGVAHEVRGTGSTRWREVIDGARKIEASALVGSAGRDAFVRPRFVGGVSFAP